jgi:superfamily II DNA/RNA helicase
LVIQAGAPANGIEFYIHRTGRTGRAGRAGSSVIFINGRVPLLNEIRALTTLTDVELPEELKSKVTLDRGGFGARPRSFGNDRFSRPRFGGDGGDRQSFGNRGGFGGDRPRFSDGDRFERKPRFGGDDEAMEGGRSERPRFSEGGRFERKPNRYEDNDENSFSSGSKSRMGGSGRSPNRYSNRDEDDDEDFPRKKY